MDNFTAGEMIRVLYAAQEDSVIRVFHEETQEYLYILSVSITTSPDGSQGVEFVV